MNADTRAADDDDAGRDVGEDLLAEFVERRDRGEVITPEQFAAEHQEGGPMLLTRLRQLLRLEGSFPVVDPVPGSEIGAYRIEREIGRGGMGRVYEVRRAGDARRFALKLLHPLVVGDERAGERLRREAEALRTFDHPGAARIHEFGDHAGMPYIVMELVDGEPLSVLLLRARSAGAARPPADRVELPGPGDGEERAAHFVAALARTVAAAHAQGIVHRDLKPSNVILRPDGKPVLIDFGLARIAGMPTLTASGDLLGTPQYMAPELVLGSGSDHRVDVYALGAILYELVTGRLPYDAMEPTAVLAMMQRLPPLPPRRREPRLGSALASIVRRALATQREHRFATAAAFADALDAFVVRRTPARLPLAMRLHDGWRWHRRKLAALLAAAVVATATIAYVGARGARVRRQVEHLLPRAIAARLAGDVADVRAAGAELKAASAVPLHEYFADWKSAGLATDAAPMVAALAAGDAAMARGDFASAVAEYRRAAGSGAPAALVAGLLGLAAAAAGDDDVAARELTAAARQVPDVALIQQRLGEVLQRRGEDDAAADALGRAAELRGNDGPLWDAAATAAGKVGRYHEALAAVQRAIECAGAGELDGYRRTQAAMLNGLGDKDASIAAFRALVDRLPPRANLFYNLGFTYDGAHRFAEARDCYERALAIDADHRDSLGCLAWMLAGARLDCAACKDWFSANPGFADPQRATDLSLRLLRLERGSRRESLAVAVEIARRAGRNAELKLVIEELAALPEQDDATVGRLLRVAKKL